MNWTRARLLFARTIYGCADGPAGFVTALQLRGTSHQGCEGVQSAEKGFCYGKGFVGFSYKLLHNLIRILDFAEGGSPL